MTDPYAPFTIRRLHDAGLRLTPRGARVYWAWRAAVTSDVTATIGAFLAGISLFALLLMIGWSR